MNKIRSFISEGIRNISYIVSGQYIKDAELEDPLTDRLLPEYLSMKNLRRAVVFCLFELIAGIAELITGIHSAMGISGSVIVTLAAVLFFLLYMKVLSSDRFTRVTVRLLLYAHWAAFSIGSVLTAVAEQLAGRTPYTFLIFAAAVFCVPVVSVKESLFFAGVLLLVPVLYGAGTGKDAVFYIAVLFTVFAYLCVATALRYYCAVKWIGERRLEMTEERCTQIAQKDSLTGLLNRDGLSAKFSEIEEDAGKKTICVVLIDIDNFRAFNHMYGYDKSDNCLYRVCNCIKIVAKPYTELVSRFGGDDFVLVFENMNAVEAVKIAEQLRRSVETMAQPFGDGIVTVSIGVSGSGVLKGAVTYSELLNEADSQLYIAKSNGRNCIGFNGRAFIHENRRPVV